MPLGEYRHFFGRGALLFERSCDCLDLTACDAVITILLHVFVGYDDHRFWDGFWNNYLDEGLRNGLRNNHFDDGFRNGLWDNHLDDGLWDDYLDDGLWDNYLNDGLRNWLWDRLRDWFRNRRFLLSPACFNILIKPFKL